MIDPQILYRLAKRLRRIGIPFLPGILNRLNLVLTGCDLPDDVEVGVGVRFQHYGRGVIVNHRTVICDNVVIMPLVVLGQSVNADGPKEASIRVEKNVLLGAGAKIIASAELTIGVGATIGANAVVTKNVPAGEVWVGIPAKKLGS